jgi:hypothetical protein
MLCLSEKQIPRCARDDTAFTRGDIQFTLDDTRCAYDDTHFTFCWTVRRL